ncbi:MAG: preprotein translocase subunit YajC [Rhodobacteraceae bacterium]|nr:preprotein translocase subunit YajC [Paracoccaceae bacterium]
MFISTAYAQAAGGDAGSAFSAFVPLILIFVIFYFLLIRPQQKKVKVHRSMLDAIRRGDKVVTNGGIVGLVTKVFDDRELQLEIAENVRVRVMRDMIASVAGKTEPAPATKDAKDAKDKGDEAPDKDEKSGSDKS